MLAEHRCNTVWREQLMCKLTRQHLHQRSSYDCSCFRIEILNRFYIRESKGWIESRGERACEFEISSLPGIGEEDDGQLRVEKANDECFESLPRAAMKSQPPSVILAEVPSESVVFCRAVAKVCSSPNLISTC